MFAVFNHNFSTGNSLSSDDQQLVQAHLIIRQCIAMLQTWNLSKILHRRIFWLKILHRQFHLILTVLVKKTQKMSENGEIYTTSKNFTLAPALTGWTNSTSGNAKCNN